MQPASLAIAVWTLEQADLQSPVGDQWCRETPLIPAVERYCRANTPHTQREGGGGGGRFFFYRGGGGGKERGGGGVKVVEHKICVCF
jgi:hypothetical protein